MKIINQSNLQEARWDKRIAGMAVQTGLLDAIEAFEFRRKDILRILAYHRIGYQNELHKLYDPALINATPEGFAEQMEYLAERYNVLSLETLLNHIESGAPLPPRSVLITFDDAYRDFLEYAWPVLKRCQLPVVLFVPTGYMEGGRIFWWDLLYRAIFQTQAMVLSLPEGVWKLQNQKLRHQAFEDLKQCIQTYDHARSNRMLKQVLYKLGHPSHLDNSILSWDEINYLNAQGVYICPHTRNHPILSRISIQEAQQEVLQSQADLYSRLGHTWPVFSFPVGHSEHLRKDLAPFMTESGFKLAVTMIEGHNHWRDSDPLFLKRVGMAPHLTLNEFRLILTGVYNLYGTFKKARSKMRSYGSSSR
jgi:peptidoglycan/xylan/chitin deacetylase (PgdA/CDA1 family)